MIFFSLSSFGGEGGGEEAVCSTIVRLQLLHHTSPRAVTLHSTITAFLAPNLVYLTPVMRYLVKARLKPGKEKALKQSIADGTLGRGSVAGDEYLHNMREARASEDGTARWVEVCFCATPLQEERPYWEEYFDLLSIKDAHARKNCRDLNGTEPWACVECDCTHRLERRLKASGQPFLQTLQDEISSDVKE